MAGLEDPNHFPADAAPSGYDVWDGLLGESVTHLVSDSPREVDDVAKVPWIARSCATLSCRAEQHGFTRQRYEFYCVRAQYSRTAEAIVVNPSSSKPRIGRVIRTETTH